MPFFVEGGMWKVEGRIQFKVFPPFTCPLPPAFRFIGPPGFEFRRVSEHLSRRGATFKNGRGQVSGGRPGTPKKPPFSRFCSVRCERVSSPLPRMQSATVIGDYGFCWGLVGDCDYDRRGRTNANPP